MSKSEEEVSAMLSMSQRKWLRGESVETPDRVMKHRIKKRYKQSIEDWGLINESDKIHTVEILQWQEDMIHE